MSKASLIQLQNITRTYQSGAGQVTALSNINLTIEENDYVSIGGPSGSGKSTLLHILGCLAKPSKGAYLLRGSFLGDMNQRELAILRKNMFGFIFQRFYLLARATVVQNVSLPMIYKGVSKKLRYERAMELIHRVGLEHRAHHRPAQLSGGEHQRVAIARSMANSPLIIMADEPTGNLDTATGHRIFDLLESLVDDGLTVIIVSHDFNIMKRSRRNLHLIDGELRNK